MQSTDDPWITHARNFPFCPYILKEKSKRFVKSALQQQQPYHTQSTMYSRYLQNQIRALDFDIITLEVQQMLTSKSTFELLSFLQSQHDRLMFILQYYSNPQKNVTTEECDQKLHTLQKQINCVICINEPRSAVLLPCTHYIACNTCLEKTGNKCSLCRTFISSIITVIPS